MVDLNVKDIALIAILVATCLGLVTVLPSSEAADDVVYGTPTNPYGGVDVNLDELVDGDSFNICKNGEVTIRLGNLEVPDIDNQLNGTGLSYDSDSKTISGCLLKGVVLSLGDIDVTLMMSNVEYSDEYPIYGILVTPNEDDLPDWPHVGSKEDPLTSSDFASEVANASAFVSTHKIYYVQVGTEVNIQRTDSYSFDEMSPNGSGLGLEIVDGSLTGTLTGTGVVSFHAIRHMSGGGTMSNITTSWIVVCEPTKYVVTFDPYAEGATCATTSLECNINGTITLPNATLSGYNFDGWYTEPEGKGTFAGSSGASYQAPGNITLYANYTEIIYNIEVDDASYQINTNGYVDHVPQFTMSDGGSTDGVEFRLVANPLGSTLSFDSTTGRLYGYLRNVMPSTDSGYVFEIEISKDGYETATQTVSISVPVFVYEPLTETLETDEVFSYVIEANPSDSFIEEVTVYKNDAVTTTGFTESHDQNNGKKFSISFETQGVWEVVLLISADGCTSTTKAMTFNVTAPTVYDDPPSIGGIQYAMHPTLNGGYYFTAVDVENANRIQWTFSDGTTESGTDTIFHRFTTQGTVVVTCMVTNSSTGQSDTASVTFNPAVTVDRTSAYVNTEYAILLPEVPNTNLTLTTSPNQSWLSIDCYESEGVNYARIHGTCTNGSLVGTEVEVKIMNGSDVYDSWEFTICADPDSQSTDFTTSINGYVVTLTNNGTSGPGAVMYIDWDGDGDFDETVRGQNTVTHDYNDVGAGTYTIRVEYNYYDVSRNVSIPNITVPSNGGSSTGFYLYFNSNGGSGQMAAMEGTTLTVPECGFTNGDLKFLGWNTQSNGQGETYMPGSKITITGTTTLYALWGSSDDPEPAGYDDVIMYVVIAILVIVIIILIIRMVM